MAGQEPVLEGELDGRQTGENSTHNFSRRRSAVQRFRIPEANDPADCGVLFVADHCLTFRVHISDVAGDAGHLADAGDEGVLPILDCVECLIQCHLFGLL